MYILHGLSTGIIFYERAESWVYLLINLDIILITFKTVEIHTSPRGKYPRLSRGRPGFDSPTGSKYFYLILSSKIYCFTFCFYFFSCQHTQIFTVCALCVAFCESIYPCIHPSMHPSIHASIHPCIHASIHPSIHPSIHLVNSKEEETSIRKICQIASHCK